MTGLFGLDFYFLKTILKLFFITGIHCLKKETKIEIKRIMNTIEKKYPPGFQNAIINPVIIPSAVRYSAAVKSIKNTKVIFFMFIKF